MLGIPSVNLDPKALKDLMLEVSSTLAENAQQGFVKAGKKAKGLAAPLIETGNEYLDTLQSLIVSATSAGYQKTKAAGSKIFQKATSAGRSATDFVGGVLPEKEVAQAELKRLANLAYQGGLKAAAFAQKTLFKTLPEKLEQGVQKMVSTFFDVKSGVKTLLNGPRDVYLQGQDSPVLLAVRMRNGFYFTVSGKPIRNIDELLTAKEDIFDSSTNDIALRWRDTADGLFDREGKRLNTAANNVMGFVGAVAYKGIQNVKGLIERVKSKDLFKGDGEGLWDKTKNLFGGMGDSLSRFGSFGTTDKRQLGLLAQIRDLLAWGKPKKVLNLTGQAFLVEALSEKFKALFGESKSSSTEQAGSKSVADEGEKSPSSSSTNPLNFDKGFEKIGQTIEKMRSEGFEAAMPKTAKAVDTVKNKVKDRFSWIINRFRRPQAVTEAPSTVASTVPQPTDWKGQMLGKLQQETTSRETKQAGWLQRAKQLSGTEPTSTKAAAGKTGDPGTASMLKGFVGELRNIFQGVGRRLSSSAGPAAVMAGGEEAMGPPRPGRVAGMRGKVGRMAGMLGSGLKSVGGMGLSLLKGAGGLLGGLLGGPTVGREISDNGPMISSTTPAVQRPETRGRRDGSEQNDSDGDGYRDGGNVEMGRRQAEENTARKDAERQKAESSRQEAKAEAFRYKTENAVDSLLNGAKGMFSMISSGISGVLELVGGFFGAKGLMGMLGKGGMFGKVLSGGKSLVGKGLNAVKTVGRPLATLGKAAQATRVVGAVSTGLRVAQVAGLAAGGLGMVGSALATVGAGVLSVLSSPVVLGAAAIGAVGYGIYKGYKYFTRNKVDDFQKLRILQYGLTTESNDIHRVLALEAYLEDGRLIYDTSGVRLNTKAIDEAEMMDIFGIDKKDQERIGRFTYWFGQRFLPFFLSSCTALLNINKKFKLKDVEKLNAEELKDFIERSKNLDGPYDSDASPFAGIDKLPNTQGEVDKVAKALWNKKPTKAEEKKSLTDSVIKNPETIANQAAKKNEVKADDQQRAKDNQVTSNKVEAERQSYLAQMRRNNADAKNPQKTDVVPNAQKGDDGGQKPPEQPNNQREQIKGSTTRPASAKGGLYGPDEGLNHLSLGKDANITNMDPAVWRNFLSMATEYGKMTGKKLQVNEAFRTYEHQSRLYQANPRKAARPGTSMHEKGLAIDISSADAATLEKMGLMTKYGFTRPIGGETWHIEPAGIQSSVDRAKKDPAWTQAQVEASLGRGGGGYGSVSGSPLGRRNPQLAKALFESGSGIQKGPPPEPKDQAAIDKMPATAALSRLPTQGPSVLSEPTKTVTDAEPSSKGQGASGNTYAQKWMGKKGAATFDTLGPQEPVAKHVGDQAKRFPELFYDPTGNPLTKQGVEKQMADRFGRLSRNYGTASKAVGTEATKPTLASAVKAEQDSSTKAQPPKVQKPLVQEDSMSNRNQMVKPKEADNSVTAVRSLVNGVEPLLKESVKLEAEMVSLMRGDMMPVLRSMNETLAKMYEHSVKGSQASASGGSNAPEASKPTAAVPGVTAASSSTLPRARKYG
jgi:LAS superfamily LD-carboxypeptidase LdcB